MLKMSTTKKVLIVVVVVVAIVLGILLYKYFTTNQLTEDSYKEMPKVVVRNFAETTQTEAERTIEDYFSNEDYMNAYDQYVNSGYGGSFEDYLAGN